MKKFLVILIAVLAFASCTKESRTYTYTVHWNMNYNAIFAYAVNEYNTDGVKVNSYIIKPAVYGETYKRKSAPGADRITMQIEASNATVTTARWVSNVFFLANTKDIYIDGTTVVSTSEPEVR